jgi:hypothetical protein
MFCGAGADLTRIASVCMAARSCDKRLCNGQQLRKVWRSNTKQPAKK